MAEEITLDFYVKYETQIKTKLTSMIQRCENPNNIGYKSYGHKGVTVCAEWRYDPEAFIYWCWEKKYFLGCHIHRLDPDKGYHPDNCVLCTPEEHYACHAILAKNKKEEIKKYSSSLTNHRRRIIKFQSKAKQKMITQNRKQAYYLELEKISLIVNNRIDL